MIGNENIKRQLTVAIDSARHRNMAPPHMLFSGHPGCGKTSMAKEVAATLKTDFISLTPESLKDNRTLLNLLDSLNFTGYDKLGNRIDTISPTVVFIDEIHRLPMFGQEKLGIIMENFSLNTENVGKVYWLPYFTVVGATTLAGNLSRPFLNRFKLNFYFETYPLHESIEIVIYHAKRLNIQITKKAAADIAIRSRGIPRIMVSFLERCRDMMLALNSQIITSGLSGLTFESLEIDRQGFNKIELKILKVLYDTDKPVSLENLAMVTGESKNTLQNEIECYLIKAGYLIRSGKGRLITPKGRNYLEAEGYAGGDIGRRTIAVDYTRL
ncbi:AAA family ATPase [bacterium]|nr:AAA family ATPase [bacterium]